MGRYGPPARPIRETLSRLMLPGASSDPGPGNLPARPDGLGLRGELVRRGATSATSGSPTALVEKDGLMFWRYADGTYLPAPEDAAARMLAEGSPGASPMGRPAPGPAPALPPADPSTLAPSDVRGRVLAALDGMVIGNWADLHRMPRRPDHPPVSGTQGGYRPQLQHPSMGSLPRDPRIPRQ